jgi:hypothetical protein
MPTSLRRRFLLFSSLPGVSLTVKSSTDWDLTNCLTSSVFCIAGASVACPDLVFFLLPSDKLEFDDDDESETLHESESDDESDKEDESEDEEESKDEEESDEEDESDDELDDDEEELLLLDRSFFASTTFAVPFIEGLEPFANALPSPPRGVSLESSSPLSAAVGTAPKPCRRASPGEAEDSLESLSLLDALSPSDLPLESLESLPLLESLLLLELEPLPESLPPDASTPVGEGFASAPESCNF